MNWISSLAAVAAPESHLVHTGPGTPCNVNHLQHLLTTCNPLIHTADTGWLTVVDRPFCSAAVYSDAGTSLYFSGYTNVQNKIVMIISLWGYPIFEERRSTCDSTSISTVLEGDS